MPSVVGCIIQDILSYQPVTASCCTQLNAQHDYLLTLHPVSTVLCAVCAMLCSALQNVLLWEMGKMHEVVPAQSCPCQNENCAVHFDGRSCISSGEAVGKELSWVSGKLVHNPSLPKWKLCMRFFLHNPSLAKMNTVQCMLLHGRSCISCIRSSRQGDGVEWVGGKFLYNPSLPKWKLCSALVA